MAVISRYVNEDGKGKERLPSIHNYQRHAEHPGRVIRFLYASTKRFVQNKFE